MIRFIAFGVVVVRHAGNRRSGDGNVYVVNQRSGFEKIDGTQRAEPMTRSLTLL
jgi:hypothetical protein